MGALNGIDFTTDREAYRLEAAEFDPRLLPYAEMTHDQLESAEQEADARGDLRGECRAELHILARAPAANRLMLLTYRLLRFSLAEMNVLDWADRNADGIIRLIRDGAQDRAEGIIRPDDGIVPMHRDATPMWRWLEAAEDWAQRIAGSIITDWANDGDGTRSRVERYQADSGGYSLN